MIEAKIIGERAHSLLAGESHGNSSEANRSEAFGICEFVMKEQLIDGCIGSKWDDNGKQIKRQGMEGAYLIAPLALRYIMTQEHLYQVAAVRGFAYYEREFRQLIQRADKDSTEELVQEKEALVRAARLLYQATGFEKYRMFADEWEVC